jgi:hypothetical protein
MPGRRFGMTDSPILSGPGRPRMSAVRLPTGASGNHLFAQSLSASGPSRQMLVL